MAAKRLNIAFVDVENRQLNCGQSEKRFPRRTEKQPGLLVYFNKLGKNMSKSKV
jgi:hypothetical protein